MITIEKIQEQANKLRETITFKDLITVRVACTKEELDIVHNMLKKYYEETTPFNLKVTVNEKARFTSYLYKEVRFEFYLKE